jgi:hypothetical protein
MSESCLETGCEALVYLDNVYEKEAIDEGLIVSSHIRMLYELLKMRIPLG